jgi:hypothetical protein
VQAAKLYFELSDKIKEARSTPRRIADVVNVTPTPTPFLPQARQSE